MSQPQSPPSGNGDAVAAAWLFALAALAFAGRGIWRMYNEAEIVGGDAYNYIISATRGVGLIGAGSVLALIACALTIVAVSKRTAP